MSGHEVCGTSIVVRYSDIDKPPLALETEKPSVGRKGSRHNFILERKTLPGQEVGAVDDMR